MVSEKLRNYEASMRRHEENSVASLEDLTYLPEYAFVQEDSSEALDRIDGRSDFPANLRKNACMLRSNMI